MLDLLIQHGLVIDGSGSPGFYATVLVKDERVTIHRGDTSSLEAGRVIDATDHASQRDAGAATADHALGA